MKEVILALNATVDGQTTAHYITDLLHDANVKVTRLAHGVPVGGELDYLDEGTLVGGDPAAHAASNRFAYTIWPATCPRGIRYLAKVLISESRPGDCACPQASAQRF